MFPTTLHPPEDGGHFKAGPCRGHQSRSDFVSPPRSLFRRSSYFSKPTLLHFTHSSSHPHLPEHPFARSLLTSSLFSIFPLLGSASHKKLPFRIDPIEVPGNPCGQSCAQKNNAARTRLVGTAQPSALVPPEHRVASVLCNLCNRARRKILWFA